ncbi:MAG: hypothetical protein RL153_1921 [Verrucomicrobiota bacterium]
MATAMPQPAPSSLNVVPGGNTLPPMTTRVLLAGLCGALAVLLGCKPASGPAPAPAPTTATPPAATPVVAQAASGAPTATAAVAPAAPTAPADEPVYHLNHAQTNLPRVRLMVGPKQLTAELCTTVTQVATGLMHRKAIGPDDAMFFAFGTRQQRSFYMKNVPFPIAVAYIDAEGVVDEVVHLKAMDTTPVPSQSANIQYVLETAPDWFERNGISKGALVTTIQGPLDTTVARLAQLQ